MKIALTGANYCGQYFPVPQPHEGVFLPFAPTLAEMFAAVGAVPDWPDVFVCVLAETFPLPLDLEACPCPTVGIVVDWEAWADVVFAHAPAFDYMLADQSGVDALARFFPEKMRTFVPVWNFSQVKPPRADRPFRERKYDVTFIGNFLPTERFLGRNDGLKLLYRLADRFHLAILGRIAHEEYLDALTDSKMLFNHAAQRVQGGINARNFEAGASGALLLAESYHSATREFFSEDEVLFYDETNLAERIQTALDDPEGSQARIRRATEKLTAPVYPRLLPVLERIVSDGERTRSARSAYGLLIGLCAGFGNWGPGSERHPAVFQMLVTFGLQLLDKRPDDPTLLNLLAVSVAEIADELERRGAPDQASLLRRHPRLNPESLWKESARLDPAFAPPMYSLGRHLIRRGDESRAIPALSSARRRIADFGGRSVGRPTLLYPVYATNATGVDRILATASHSATFDARNDDEQNARRAQLLRWRIEEVLGDLLARRNRLDAALRQYLAAADAAPDLCTEALRKALQIATHTDDAKTAVVCLERIIAINPLDLPHRERLDAYYAAQGREDPALREEIRLLTKAVPNRRIFERPPFDEL